MRLTGTSTSFKAMTETPAPPPASDLRTAFLEEKAFRSRTVLVFGAISDEHQSELRNAAG